MTPIEKALQTWYKPDNPLYKNPRHPVIKLAGEAGELLDLFGKHQYKPGFNWLACRKCNEQHNECICGNYVSKLEDELGDWWYYCRILAWQNEIELGTLSTLSGKHDFMYLVRLNYHCARLLLEYEEAGIINSYHLQTAYNYFYSFIQSLDITLEQLTESNYLKLNSDPTNHGWRRAR